MDERMCQMKPQTLAMVEIEYQKWRHVMDGGSGLRHGTIFQELVLPFYGTQAACSMRSRRERGGCDNERCGS